MIIEYPKMLYKGDETMIVESKEEQDKAKGWSETKKAPKAKKEETTEETEETE